MEYPIWKTAWSRMVCSLILKSMCHSLTASYRAAPAVTGDRAQTLFLRWRAGPGGKALSILLSALHSCFRSHSWGKEFSLLRPLLGIIQGSEGCSTTLGPFKQTFNKRGSGECISPRSCPAQSKAKVLFWELWLGYKWALFQWGHFMVGNENHRILQ